MSCEVFNTHNVFNKILKFGGNLNDVIIDVMDS